MGDNIMKPTPEMIVNYKDAIMANAALSDMEKLQKIFDVSKENLKKSDPQLYYAILAVLDKHKKLDSTAYFNSEE